MDKTTIQGHIQKIKQQKFRRNNHPIWSLHTPPKAPEIFTFILLACEARDVDGACSAHTSRQWHVTDLGKSGPSQTTGKTETDIIVNTWHHQLEVGQDPARPQ